ncbi:hypothetical protein DWW90_17555 [Parabacteroides sp. AF17-28]|nr:hypothetical protein DWW90_17555 [Parabacteroides sp. AF17-28]
MQKIQNPLKYELLYQGGWEVFFNGKKTLVLVGLRLLKSTNKSRKEYFGCFKALSLFSERKRENIFCKNITLVNFNIIFENNW